MTDELRMFRDELATPSPAAAAQARRRLEAAVAAERDARRPLRSPGRMAALAAASLLLLAALATGAAGLLGRGGDAVRASEAGRTAPQAARSPAPRAGFPDGRFAFAPPEGKDAGMRPRLDTGGWSECGIDGCYLLL